MLITCKECGAKISDKADKCPQCGAPLRETVTDIYFRKRNKDVPYNWRLRLGLAFWSVVAIIVIAALFRV